MKKAWIVLAVAFLAAGMSLSQGRVVGPSPQTLDIQVTVTIPTRVGIYLERDASIDVGAAPNLAHYPPTAFPGYYVDNTNFGGANGTTQMEVFCNASTGYDLTVQAGAANFYAGGPAVTQLYFAPAGTAQTADGAAAPAAPWTAFNNAAAVNVLGAAARTNGWEAHHQDFELQLLGTEDAGTGTVDMTYTITARP
jgi:hypothetical protein